MRARAGAVAVVALLLGCRAPKVVELPVRTFALPAPELREPAFEPSIAIDPDHPDHLVIGAQYGIGYNRGGRKIWSWESVDGGRTWEGAEIPLPNSGATLSADVVTEFGTDGRPLIGFLYADSRFRGGLAIARGGPGATGFGPARLVVPDRMDRGEGAVDKPWLVVDRGPKSPLHGTLYFTWHLNRPLPNHTVASTLWIASSRDGARWTEPARLAEDFGGQVTVRSDGTVDVLFGDRADRGIYHRTSADGGRSFGPVDTVRRVEAPLAIDLPTIAATANRTVAYCAAIDSAADLRSRRVHCTAGSEVGGWGRPTALEETRVSALPALAADRSGVWALAYRSDSARTEVVLYRSSDGGLTYREQTVLASRPFGIQHACLAPGGPCRRAPPESKMFFPGDYIGLAVAPGRLAAAFVFPLGDAPDGQPTVHASVIELDRFPVR
jgi:hypothetical protein